MTGPSRAARFTSTSPAAAAACSHARRWTAGERAALALAPVIGAVVMHGTLRLAAHLTDLALAPFVG